MDLVDIQGDATHEIYGIFFFIFTKKHLWGLPYSKFAIILCYLFFKIPQYGHKVKKKVEPIFQGAYDGS